MLKKPNSTWVIQYMEETLGRPAFSEKQAAVRVGGVHEQKPDHRCRELIEVHKKHKL